MAQRQRDLTVPTAASKGDSVSATSFRPDVFSVEPLALLASSCAKCARKAFPPRDVCPACGSISEAEPVRLGTEGRVYSFTVVRQAPAGLETPYVLGYVDLPDDDVRVLARIEGLPPEHVDIGLPVRLGVRPAENADAAVDMFVFRYAAEEVSQ
jgi:uncharacterized OB-fold protein